LSVSASERPPGGRGARLKLVAAGVLAAAPAFLAYASYILNNFYRDGAVMLDTGLLADLAWRNGPMLPVRLVYSGASFYTYHIAPIFVALSGLSWLAPLSMAQWFAVFTGVAQALMAVAVFWVLVSEYGLRRGWRLAGAMLLAVAFSFNGLAIAQVRYPHFEVLIASALMLFLVAFHQRRFALAAAFFALALICREDAGFHAFAILFVLVAVQRLKGAPLSAQRPALAFMAVGFLYSVAALSVGHVFFPSQSSFARVYLGDPPLAHLTPALIAFRAQGLVGARAYILLPALVAAAWAIWTRNPFIVVGYLALIPWALVNLLAKGELAGTLSSYYAFPFLIAAFWPLVGARLQPSTRAWEPFVGFAVMILVSFAAVSAQHDPSREPLWRGFTDPPSLAEQGRVERAMDAIRADHTALGRLAASDSLVALRPREFQRGETSLETPPAKVDTTLGFTGDRQSRGLAALAAVSHLERAYIIPGTPIQVATNADVARLPHLGPLLRPRIH
jgi:hypothetical protein